MDNNVGEGAISETLGLDVIAEGGEITVQLNAAPIIFRRLLRRRVVHWMVVVMVVERVTTVSR